MPGLDSLLGKGGDPPVCKVVAPDISIHWYPTHEVGTACVCGATVSDRDWDEEEARAGQAPSDG